MNKLSPQSLFVMQWFPPFFEVIIFPISILFLVVFPLWYVRKQFLKYDKSLWKTAKWPLILSLLPLLFVLREGVIALFAMGDFSLVSNLLKAISYLLCSIAIFAFGLWIKKIFDIRRLIFFVKGLCIGFILSLMILGAFLVLQGFILRKDPAYLSLLQRIEESKQKRALED